MTTFLKLKSCWINRDSIVSVSVATRSDNGEQIMRVGLANGDTFTFMDEELEAMADYLAAEESRNPGSFLDLMARHEAAAEEARRAEPARQLSRLAAAMKGRFPMLRAWVTGNSTGSGNRLVLLREGFHAVVVEALPEGGFGVTKSEKKVEAGMDFCFGQEQRVADKTEAFERAVSLIDADTIEALSEPEPQNRRFYL